MWNTWINIIVFSLKLREKNHYFYFAVDLANPSLHLAHLLAASLTLGFVTLCYLKAREAFSAW